jgi:hypothetical protein
VTSVVVDISVHLLSCEVMFRVMIKVNLARLLMASVVVWIIKETRCVSD